MLEKQKLEEIAADLLDENNTKNFLDFNEFLRNNKVSKSKTDKAGTSWSVRYKNKIILHYRIRKDFWFISYFKGFTQEKWFEKCEKYLTEELRDFILNNINTNPGCGTCKGVENQVVLGKTFDRVCHCHALLLHNPDSKALEYAKELVSINKNIADDIAANKT